MGAAGPDRLRRVCLRMPRPRSSSRRCASRVRHRCRWSGWTACSMSPGSTVWHSSSHPQDPGRPRCLPASRRGRRVRSAGIGPRPGTATSPPCCATSRPRWRRRSTASLAAGTPSPMPRTRWPAGTASAVLLVVDDLHTLEGTPAEAALERLIEYAPPSLTICAASRVPPASTCPGCGSRACSSSSAGTTSASGRGRSSASSVTSTRSRCRRRSSLAWPARPRAGRQDCSSSTSPRAAGRPTSGAACSTALGVPGSRLMRDYLTRNVLHELPEDLRRFLVETSVLGRLSGPLCDRCCERTGSRDVLDELERRRLFTQRLAEGGIYRYHEVLRSHLQGVLLDEVGEERARERFALAGELLAESVHDAEALEAFCRGEDGLPPSGSSGGKGRRVATAPARGSMPSRRRCPARPLAAARDRPPAPGGGPVRRRGRRYRRAETSFGAMSAAVTCRDERQALAAWLGGPTAPRRDWANLLRTALRRDPLAVARDAGPDVADGRLVQGLALLVGGEVAEARRRLLVTAEDRLPTGPAAQVVASLAAGIAAMLAGQARGAVEVRGSVVAAESLGLEWLARLGRASLAIGDPASIHEAEAVAAACAAAADAWGEAVAGLCVAWGSVLGGAFRGRGRGRAGRALPGARCAGARGMGTRADGAGARPLRRSRCPPGCRPGGGGGPLKRGPAPSDSSARWRSRSCHRTERYGDLAE